MQIEKDPNIGIKRLKIEGENFYQISNFNEIRPFFMSIVSDSHHWMFHI